MKRMIAFVAVALLLSSKPSFANTIPVFNTGVDNSGQVLTNGAVDPHWFIASEPLTILDPPAYTATSASGYPVAPNGPWIGDNTTSDWINPSSNNPGGSSSAGDWTYETDFNFTGNPATASLSGQFAVQDQLVAILLNGVNVGSSLPGNYTSWTPFMINTGFVNGQNQLDFVVDSNGGPNGLRVEFASPVPEPGSIVLVGSGLVGLAGLVRRRRKTS